jgi:predicted AlkP superfamily pyrophosphatase or phosphodiesterase
MAVIVSTVAGLALLSGCHGVTLRQIDTAWRAGRSVTPSADLVIRGVPSETDRVVPVADSDEINGKSVGRSVVAASVAEPVANEAPVAGPLTEVISSAAVPGVTVVVPGPSGWVATGVPLGAGQPFTILAEGEVAIGKAADAKGDVARLVGPEGTFFYDDRWTACEFPLPAAGNGPAPCFCLIGRIVDEAGRASEPFVLGARCSREAPCAGQLELAINDFDPTGNTGGYSVCIRRPAAIEPHDYREPVSFRSKPGARRQCGPVVVFYVDGLRPDVVEEMSAMGHLPNITERFIAGGTHLAHAFTAFPSDTITSNGTMWTGCFSDRHGLKGQVRFNRSRQASDSFLEPMGPNRSARWLGPKGVDRLLLQAQSTSVALWAGQEGAKRWESSQTSGIPALYDHLRADGGNWATGVLPLMTDVPPLLWTRSMTRQLPYFRAHQAWQYIDDANTDYTLRQLIRQNQPVTIVWLPETDSVSHKQNRGQFGSTRRTIAHADRLIGQVVEELTALGRLETTYFVLVSDHGHLGGEDANLSRFDLANEFFHEQRAVRADGTWTGGGLGLSVRQHRYSNPHTDDAANQFVFIDGDSDGAARVFLPKGEYASGNWSGPSQPADLLTYRVSPKHPPVNLPESLAAIEAQDDRGCPGRPVDLVLMRIAENAIGVVTCDRGSAVIERRPDPHCPERHWVYRYTPVEALLPGPNGTAVWTAQTNPTTDPLGIVDRVRPEFLAGWHDEQEWLWITATSDYPDSVVALSRHLLYQENLREIECDYAPDLVVTARRGWFFGVRNTPGTTHGYPLAESMRASFFVSGPGVRKGAIVERPCRLVDLTPTLLEMTGTKFDPNWFDGRAIREFYEPCEIADREPPVAMNWSDYDLGGWGRVCYTPKPAYLAQPVSINDSAHFWDLNNIAYNLISIGDWSVFRLVDDATSLVVPGRVAPTQTVVDSVDRKARRAERPWVRDAAPAVNMPGVALADYSLTSLGNLKRADEALNWLQTRSERLDQALAAPVGRTSVIATPVANRAVDGVQGTFWELYRFAQRLLVEILDETILNGVENGVDAGLNATRATPAERPAE